MTDGLKESVLDLAENFEKKTDLPMDIKSADEFKVKIASFVVRQLHQIEGINELQKKVVGELSEKISLHLLSTTELMQLFNTLGNQKATNTSVLLDLFKPGNGATMTPLLVEKKEETKDELDEIFNKMKPEQRMAMLNVFQKLVEASNEIKREEGERE